jgi:hypothetical protein
VFVFHYEIDRITSLAATKTFEDPLCRGDSEGWRFLIVERTEAQVVHTPLLQGYILLHHVNYLRGIQNPFYGIVINHIPKIVMIWGLLDVGM